MNGTQTNSFHVGQKVIMTGVNMRGTREVEVVKVGTKLVYVEDYGRPVAYRIDTGVRNDAYGHTRIRTVEQFEAEQARRTAVKRLADLGLAPGSFGPVRYSTETLNAVCDLLERDVHNL